MTLKRLTVQGVAYGPYNNVEIMSDRYRCDGSDLPFVVVGENGTIDDWEGPIPTSEEIILVPKEVTMRQARLALLDAGLLQSVVSAIENMDEPLRTRALVEWEYSNTVERHGQLTGVIGQLIGLTEHDIDDLFIDARTK